MITPKVTVLMPVYNGERFLREAVESILNQSFSDFEFIIINDGSSDHSVEIITSYNDSRINLVHNEKNLGLIATLNRGIALAKGEYIARMDCDDISLPERLSKQIEYLETHPECTLVAVKCYFIDSVGEECGFWNDDSKFTSYGEIVQRLPRANCIAHPGVMIGRQTLSTYEYDPRQVNSEDYDLWLRLIADGHRIDKLDECLLKYRLSPLSITFMSNRRNPDLKNVRTKSRFVLNRLITGRFNCFVARVFLNIFKDLYYFLGKLVVNQFVDSVAVIGRFIGSLLPVRNRSGLFFFFPFCHIGGAERVHADIVNCFADLKPWVFFTKWSPRPGALRGEFDRVARTFNWCLRLKYTYPLSVWLMAGFINKHPNSVVFGCNTLFFYKMLPHLSEDVRVVDLLHAFGGGSEDFSLPVIHHIDKRVVITLQTRMDLMNQYRVKGIDTALGERIELIENRVDVPHEYREKGVVEELNILYVGRGSEEKRVHIAGRVAALCASRKLPVTVTMIGNVTESVAMSDRPFCQFTGELTDQVELNGYYERAHLLLLTSSREGFPLVIMEAMAQGVVPISTAVGGIPQHVKSGVTGLLIENLPNEDLLAEAMFAAIEKLTNNRDQMMTMSRNAYDYARDNFGGERFCRLYRSTLLADIENHRNGNAQG
ncbi:MAG: glycosyltransferase [Desulfuromonadaceae bacterium]|nr:glycosyltransferase [Desulfuromonadaceae bacterium]